MMKHQKEDENKIDRIKILLRDFSCNLLEIEECHKWNSPINIKNLPLLKSEQKKIATEICQITTSLKDAGVPLDNIIKTFSEEISKNIRGNSGKKYYYRIWRGILRGDIEKYYG